MTLTSDGKKLAPKKNKWFVKRVQLRLLRDEMFSRYHKVLASARRLVLANTSNKTRLKDLHFKFHFLYDDSRKVRVLAGPPLQVAESILCVRELDSQTAEEETERGAAVAALNASKPKLGALQALYADLDFEVTRIHSEIDVVKRLCAERAS